MVLLLTGGSVVAEGPNGRRDDPRRGLLPVPHDDVARAGRADRRGALSRFCPPGAGARLRRVHPPPRRLCDRRGRRDRRLAGDGRSQDVRLAACGIASRPVRLREAEAAARRHEALGNRTLSSAPGEAAKDAVTAPDDMHATTAYRRQRPCDPRPPCGRDGARNAPDKDAEEHAARAPEAFRSRRLIRPEGARLAHGEWRAGRARRQRAHAALRFPPPRARGSPARMSAASTASAAPARC